MNCSSFETLIEHYLEGDLLPRERAELSLHLDRCDTCAGLFEEVRVVDALLMRPRRLDPAPNFTFSVMAEVRSLPPPVRRRTRLVPWLLGYLAISWVVIAVAFIAAHGPIEFAVRGFVHGLAVANAALGSLATDVLLRGPAGDAFAFAGSLLLADIALGIALVAAYAIVRQRIAGRFGRSEVRS